MNLNQVLLTVKDIKLSIEFYQKLGFNLIVETENYARFECLEGDATFSLFHCISVLQNPKTTA